MGGQFLSDGRLQGTQVTQVIECDQTNNQCIIPMRAPSFALVFLTDDAMARSSAPQGSAAVTFATTTTKNGGNRPVINSAILATMNGDGGPNFSRLLGSTGRSSPNAGIGMLSLVPGLGSLIGVVGCLLAIQGFMA